VLAIAVALVPPPKPTFDWVIEWTSLLLAVFDLAALITMVELISIMVFKYKVENPGLGHISALCLATVQILEVLKVAHRLGWRFCVKKDGSEEAAISLLSTR
jgi:hypothetical protein